MSTSVTGKNGPAIPANTPRSYEVKVLRQSLPPRQWFWMIVDESNQTVAQKSQETYRSAQEAWEVGRRRLGKPA
jgi:hypothetical protein